MSNDLPTPDNKEIPEPGNLENMPSADPGTGSETDVERGNAAALETANADPARSPDDSDGGDQYGAALQTVGLEPVLSLDNSDEGEQSGVAFGTAGLQPAPHDVQSDEAARSDDEPFFPTDVPTMPESPEEPTNIAVPTSEPSTIDPELTPIALESEALLESAATESIEPVSLPEAQSDTIAPPGGAEPTAEPKLPEGTAGKYDAMRHLPPEQAGGIEFLIQMAEKGEIDPKNIDIIDVTDRFLKAIAAAPKENLRQSGKIIFQASVLLRMKAEALIAARVAEEMAMMGDDDFVEYDDDGMPLIFDGGIEPIARQITLQDLERALVRQTKVRQLRHRRVTLEQLIEALREAERLEKTRGERKVKPTIAVDGFAEMRDMDDILDLAHDEDIEDTISRIESLLSELLESDNMIPLREIVENVSGRGHWVDVFLAVLFLANAGKIALHQEQFYGPLFVLRSEQQDGQTSIVPPLPTEAGVMNGSVTAH